ncbi:bifunctional DNA primase/polymerase [Methylobacterium sp. CCH5-D2]|uniref:bifunctional DNA primase/polymerase n=1 Tax=Methylobacterium sp. CCH5-D2 TaxID=1768765 RepID=UPI00082FDE94|nr:bifunctional DNA primase/polymerase [Methylobacterium sp. CCH5-D2]
MSSGAAQQFPPTGMVEHALEWAGRGFRVFPCDPSPAGEGSKRPLVARDKDAAGKPIPKTGGFYKATTDEATIRRWWMRWPGALIGVRMGREAGVFAVDPDVVKKPGDADGLAAWTALVAQHGGEPHTHTHRTPSGGRHVLLRYPEGRDVTNGEGNLPAGINVRGEGGYVIVPPSAMQDGRTYQHEEPEHAFSFADAPGWLLDLILGEKPTITERARAAREDLGRRTGKAGRTKGSERPASSAHERYVRSAVEAECDVVAKAAPGGRNNTLNRAAFNLGTLIGAGVLDAREAMLRLLLAAHACGLVADKGEDRATATIESGLTAGAEHPREMPERKGRAGAAKRSRKERESAPESDDVEDARPIVFITAGRIPEAADRTEEILLSAGVEVFSRAGTLARPVTDSVPASKGRTTTIARLRPLCGTSLADLAARVMRFRRFDKRSNEWVDMNPPAELMQTLLVREGQWRIPPVAGVITTPTLRPDGSLLAEPGYDPETRLFLALDPTFRLPPVPETPTRAEAMAALQLLEELLAGFPFVEPVDRAVALSGILTAVVRGTMPVAPLHAIRAHSPGTGKSLLVDIASAIATGRHCPVIAAGKTEEETEKRLGALLRDAVAVVSIDNVNGELGGDMLCQMTERPLVRVRVLGRSEAPELEIRSTTFATGNNLILVGDMTRRTVLCTLDAKVERPELRTFDFDPVERVLADRGAFVAAAMTVIRAYRAAGSPQVCGPIGSYADWSQAVRAPLIWLGHADPVASMETAREEDPELSAIRELFGHWREHLGSSPYTTNAIIQAACERDSFGGYGPSDFKTAEFRDLLLRQAGDGGAVNSRKLGKWLSRISGRVVEGMRIEMKGSANHGSRFTLVSTAYSAQKERAYATAF